MSIGICPVDKGGREKETIPFILINVIGPKSMRALTPNSLEVGQRAYIGLFFSLCNVLKLAQSLRLM